MQRCNITCTLSNKGCDLWGGPSVLFPYPGITWLKTFDVEIKLDLSFQGNQQPESPSGTHVVTNPTSRESNVYLDPLPVSRIRRGNHDERRLIIMRDGKEHIYYSIEPANPAASGESDEHSELLRDRGTNQRRFRERSIIVMVNGEEHIYQEIDELFCDQM